MNLINDDKQKLYQLVCNHYSEKSSNQYIPGSDSDCETYYIERTNEDRLFNIMEYSFNNPEEFKKYLLKIWASGEGMNDFLATATVCTFKGRTFSEDVHNLELHNHELPQYIYNF